MLFSSTIFIFLFLPIVLILYYLVFRGRRARNLVLLTASLGFYAWGEPWFVVVMMFSILCNWFFGLLVDRFRQSQKHAQRLIILMLIVNFSILFIYKYLLFVLTNLNYIFNKAIPLPTILLPIGISFFTFQGVSYVLDIYRNDAEVQNKLSNVALYIALFPQLIAGPIVRYKTIAEQIEHRIETMADFSIGIRRFILGLGKKVLIANTLALVADASFAMKSSEMSVAFAWLGAFAYAFQIFFDFSGYSDMAIGLGRMFGFHFLENFNYPYISKSVSEFWRRWHISLSTWFRDYVYFPMGGSRVATQSKLIFNLFVVWTLTGIWHGANWTFIAWGFFYFLLLILEKMTNFEKALTFTFLKRIYVILAVLIGWVLFRSLTLSAALDYLRVMFGFSGNPLLDQQTLLTLKENALFYLYGILFSMPIYKWLKDRVPKTTLFYIGDVLGYIIICLLSIAAVINSSYNPFIYFNF